MRLTLDAAPPAVLVVADDGSTVTGTAVPYAETGVATVAGEARRVRFVPGSISAAQDYPVPFCLDHDLAQPVGVVASLDETPDALMFTASLDPVPAAEHARAQMRSRSRSGVSVSVDVVEASDDPDGTLAVHSAELVELSSVVRPAFRSARVAAHERTPMPDTLTPVEAARTAAPDPAPVDDTPPPAPDAPARVPSHMPRHSGGSPVVAPTVSAFARDVVRRLRAAGGDEPSARSLRGIIEQADHDAVRAALANTTNADWAVPGTYLAEIDNYVRRGMPEVEGFVTRPTDRWPVYQPVLTTKPVPGKTVGEKVPIPSNTSKLDFQQVDGETYAWGTDLSVQLVEDAGESVISDLLEIASEEVGRLIASDFVAAVEGAAQTGPTGITLDSIGAAIGLVAGTGRAPSVILAAPDVYGTLWTLIQSGGPALSAMTGLDETPRVTLASTMTAGTLVVGARDAIRTHMSRVARLRAVDVSLLGIDVGVYRRAQFRVADPLALVAVTATTP